MSRATLYSGQYVSRHKSDHPHKPLWYDGWNEAWPQIMRNNGYHLGHIGKWHFNWTKLVSNTFYTAQAYYGQHWYPQPLGGRIHATTKKWDRYSLRFLKKRPKNKPFILSTCFFALHSFDGTDEQYFPQEQSMSLYENETVAVPISATDDAWKKMPPFFTGKRNLYKSCIAIYWIQ